MIQERKLYKKGTLKKKIIEQKENNIEEETIKKEDYKVKKD